MSSLVVDTKDQIWFSTKGSVERIDAQGHLSIDSIPLQNIWYRTIEKDICWISTEEIIYHKRPTSSLLILMVKSFL